MRRAVGIVLAGFVAATSAFEAEKIWTELRRLRAEPRYMDRVLSRYPARKGVP